MLVITPTVFGDDRGFFVETFNEAAFTSETGIERTWVQDNHSRSRQGVLRGLHFQNPQAQGKLVRCSRGAVFDVAVDVRRSSKTFLRWVGIELSESNHTQLWVPEGFAHGFLVLTEVADLQYKTTDYYAPTSDAGIRWDDPDIGIDWPLTGDPIVSAKDADLPHAADAALFD